jgi:hypothetical protein
MTCAGLELEMEKSIIVDERILAIRNRTVSEGYGLAWIIAVAFFLAWPLLDRPWMEVLPLIIALLPGAFYVAIRAMAAGLFTLETSYYSRTRTIVVYSLGFTGYFIYQLLRGSSFWRSLWSAALWIILFSLGMYAVYAASNRRAHKKEQDD